MIHGRDHIDGNKVEIISHPHVSGQGYSIVIHERYTGKIVAYVSGAKTRTGGVRRAVVEARWNLINMVDYTGAPLVS